MAGGFYWSANSPFIQKHWVRARRAPRAPALGDVASGFIDTLTGNGRTHRNANPAYMIYECLTNTVWGMGAGAEEIDTASFSYAAQVFRNENFGLFMLWTASDTIENFVSEILDHVQAMLYLAPTTGLWTLTPLRADYDVSTLARYTVDNATFTEFARKLIGETVNEIIVKWTNPVTEQEETVGTQDLANVVAQGGQVVSQDRNYYGVRSSELAGRLAARDLRSAVTPLRRCMMRVNRRAWAETPGRCVVIDVPDEDVTGLVMRVQSVDYGDRSDAYIKVSLLEDIFAFYAPVYTGTASSAQIATAQPPNPPSYVKLLTLPAFVVANSGEVFSEMPEEPEVSVGVLAADANTDFVSLEPYTNVTLPTGQTQVQSIGTRDSIGFYLTSFAFAAESSTTIPFPTNLFGQTPRLAALVFIGSSDDVSTEIALVQAIDGDGNYILARGVLDTVPRAWPTGTPVWFLNSQRYIDPTLRAPGETVSYRTLMRTSVNLLAYADGVDSTITLTARPYLPLRPANVKVNGQGFDTVALNSGSASVTWSNRNRLTETAQIFGWASGTMAPEAGQTTTIDVLDGGGVVLRTFSGLTGTSTTLTAANVAGGAALRVASARGSYKSLQAFALSIIP